MAVTNVRMQIDQQSQDIANNYSIIRVRGFATTTGSSFNNNTKTGTYIIDGQSYSFSTTLPKNTTKTLFDAQHTIYHNADGTKIVYGSFSLATGISAGTISASTSLALNTIPRATSCPNISGYIGKICAVNINPASFSFTHRLVFVWNGQEVTLQDNFNYQIYFTVPTSFYSYIPNSTQLTGEIRLYTYSGGTQIGVSSASATFQVTFDSTNTPVINGFTVIDKNETTIALTGDANKIVNNFSNIEVNIDAYAQASASLKEYALGYKIDDNTNGFYDSSTQNPFTIENFAFLDDASDPKTMVVYVKDTREVIELNSLDISDRYIDYFKIYLMPEDVLNNSYVAFARPQIFSDEMKLGFAGEYWKGNFGLKENSLSITWRVKANKGSFSDWQTLQPNVDYLDMPGALPRRQYFATGDIEPVEGDRYRYYPINIKNPLSEDGTWNYLTTYTFEIVYQDELEYQSYTRVVYPSNPIYSWYQDKDTKENHFEVYGNLDIQYNNEMRNIFDLIFPIGRGFIDFTGQDFTNYLGFTWERTLVGLTPIGYDPDDPDFNEMGKVMGEKTHTLTINEMPVHKHEVKMSWAPNQSHNHSGGTYAMSFAEGANPSDGTYQSTDDRIANSGGGQSHNNIQPSQVVAYWKRIM